DCGRSLERPPRLGRVQARDDGRDGRPRARPGLGGGAARAKQAMTFTQECVIPVERERLWDFMMEVPRVARCVPGVEAVEAMDTGAYRGSLKVQVGPIRLALEGVIPVQERDRDAWRARMRAEGNERRLGGGVHALMGLQLVPDHARTEL